MNNPQSSILNPQSPDGVLIIDKPVGLTSHDVVARVRRILKTRRVGHTGTLDPFATGVLVVCLNRATRLAQFLSGDEKEYLATMRLGWTTDTGDLTGTPSSPIVDASQVTPEMVAQALGSFRGRIRQTPPMYSAKKIGGVKLYEMARRGETIEREPVEIEIKELELEEGGWGLGAGGWGKDCLFRVVCSSGTYIRTLAEEIGQKLGVGAHLIALHRTRAGRCDLSRAISLETLAELMESDQMTKTMVGMAEAIDGDELILNEQELKSISHGRAIVRSDVWPPGEQIKLCDSSRELIAIAFYDADKRVIQPRIVFK